MWLGWVWRGCEASRKKASTNRLPRALDTKIGGTGKYSYCREEYRKHRRRHTHHTRGVLSPQSKKPSYAKLNRAGDPSYPDPYESIILHSAACSQSNRSTTSACSSSNSQRPVWDEERHYITTKLALASRVLLSLFSTMKASGISISIPFMYTKTQKTRESCFDKQL